MAEESEAAKQDETRLHNFARFFKSYMSVWAIVTAALPVPLTSMHLIPTYAAQTSLLSTYTTLFCFLLLGFIFYSRHWLARVTFVKSSRFSTVITMAPLMFIVASIGLVFSYHAVLNRSLSEAMKSPMQLIEMLSKLQDEMEKNPKYGDFAKELSFKEMARTFSSEIEASKKFRDEILPERAAKYGGYDRYYLATQSQNAIPYGNSLMALYLAMFICAECAFILMAIKEYLQDLLGITELDLIKNYKTL